ncbi:unnamed protein product [Caenorhabditis sp. 36 PRJEB53466]|nr:unnamed protein product [Caenorhabditis sp. 36 PRJEB53466]
MSSKVKNNNGTEVRVYEITSIIFASVMIFVSMLVIFLNFHLARRVLHHRRHPIMRKLRKMVPRYRSAVKNGMLTATETVILALEAGMTLEGVRLEYVNSGATREEILESILGKLPAKFFNRLKTAGRFLEVGMANEKVFLDLWNSQSYRDLVMTANLVECRTQTYILPVNSAALSSENNQTDGDSTVNKANPDRSPPGRSQRQSQRQTASEKAKSMFLPEGKPLICSGVNDDAQ